MQDADAKERDVKHTVRVSQYTALLLMRQLQACTDEVDAIRAIDWMDLSEREFVELALEQQLLLSKAIAVLRILLQNKNASVTQMRAALTPDQYKQYVKSFDSDISHTESEWENRPSEIDEYLRVLKLGDLLNGLSERISGRARYSAKGVRYTSTGATTAAAVWHKAEGYYEDALMYLQGLCESAITAAELQHWFDRELDFNPETGTLSADAVGVPRLRGSNSHNCLDKTRNLWGATKSKYYRQRESISESVYKLLFVDEESDKFKVATTSTKLQQLLRDISPEIDWI